MAESHGGGCCPPMDLMRSEPMQLVQVIVPMKLNAEEVRITLNSAGIAGGRRSYGDDFIKSSLSPRLTLPCEKLSLSRSKRSVFCSLSEEPKEESLSRRSLVYVLVTSPCLLLPVLSSSAKTKSKSPYDARRLLEQNKRIQKENNAPDEFPNFVREGFEVEVVASDNYIKADSGLIYRDFTVGQGDCPKDQQVDHQQDFKKGKNNGGRRNSYGIPTS